MILRTLCSKARDMETLSGGGQTPFCPHRIHGREYRELTSKELAAVCLAALGEPEAAKDKPRWRSSDQW